MGFDPAVFAPSSCLSGYRAWLPELEKDRRTPHNQNATSKRRVDLLQYCSSRLENSLLVARLTRMTDQSMRTPAARQFIWLVAMEEDNFMCGSSIKQLQDPSDELIVYRSRKIQRCEACRVPCRMQSICFLFIAAQGCDLWSICTIISACLALCPIRISLRYSKLYSFSYEPMHSS